MPHILQPIEPEIKKSAPNPQVASHKKMEPVTRLLAFD
jgi:hypothetical protein